MVEAKVQESRRCLEVSSAPLLGVNYGVGIGPSVYDIHSTHIPSTEEIVDRISMCGMRNCGIFCRGL